MAERTGEPSSAAIRGRCGAISLWIALGALITAAIALAVMLGFPNSADLSLRESVTLITILVLFVLAPLENVVGLGFGLLALVRRNRDRPWLGAAGVFINILALLTAAGILVVALAGAAGVR